MLSDEGAVYGPEELSLLGKVLDQVMQSLPPNLRTPYNRAAIARNILACALTGERDPRLLGQAALMNPMVPGRTSSTTSASGAAEMASRYCGPLQPASRKAAAC
jgi:hypothetical protein